MRAGLGVGEQLADAGGGVGERVRVGREDLGGGHDRSLVDRHLAEALTQGDQGREAVGGQGAEETSMNTLAFGSVPLGRMITLLRSFVR